MASKSHNFIDISIVGLDVIFDKLISYSKRIEKDVMKTMRGVNANTINVKITSAIIRAMHNQDRRGIKTDNKIMQMLINSFKIKKLYRDKTDHMFTSFNSILNGQYGLKLMTKGSHVDKEYRKSTRTHSITLRRLLKVFMYGRDEFKTPLEPEGRMRFMVYKGHGNTHYTFHNWRMKGKLTVPAYKGINYNIIVQREIEKWYDELDDKFFKMSNKI